MTPSTTRARSARAAAGAFAIACVAFAAALAPRPALAEASLDDPLARAPEHTLRAMLPRLFPPEAYVTVEGNDDGAEGAFQVTFEALLDQTVVTLLVSERDLAKRIVRPALDSGAARDALIDDEDFAGEWECGGSSAQAMIVCRFEDAILQMTGATLTGAPIPYEDLRAYFDSIDRDVVTAAVAP